MTVPIEPGWYFARHTKCLYPWARFEPVELIDITWNNDFRVRVGGLATLLYPDTFTWGPRITLPDDLAVEEAQR